MSTIKKFVSSLSGTAIATLVVATAAALILAANIGGSPEWVPPATLILLEDGSLIRPSDSEPISKDQNTVCRGTAFFGRRSDGSVCLVSAAHVAEHLPEPHEWLKVGEDVAVLKIWAPGTFPDADSVPEFGELKKDQPCLFYGWNIPLNRTAQNLATVPKDPTVDRFPGQLRVIPRKSQDDMLPGTSGSPVYQRGRIVGVHVGGVKRGDPRDYSVRFEEFRFQPFAGIW